MQVFEGYVILHRYASYDFILRRNARVEGHVLLQYVDIQILRYRLLLCTLFRFDANLSKCKSTKQLFMYFVLQTFPLQNFAVDFFSILRCLQNKMFNNSRVQFLTVKSLGCQVHSAQSNVVRVLGVNCKVIYRY